MHFLAQADTGSAAYTCGAFGGALIPVVFLLLAIRSLGHSDRSSKCAWSMILFMSGWTLLILTYGVFRATESNGIAMIGAVLATPLWLATLVFAVLGIMEVSGNPDLKGLGQAITAIVLVVVFGLISFIASRGGKDAVPSEWKLPPPVPGSRILVADKNFSLVEPGSDWTRLEPRHLNPRADLAFVNEKKTMFMIVVSIPVPPNMVLPADRFVDAARQEMKQMDPGASVGASEIRYVDKYQGLTFSAEVNAKGQAVTYCEWVTSQPYFGYQIVVFGPRASAALVKSELERISSTFQYVPR